MAKTRRFFISDVHLGGDANKAWFQPDLHEAPLLAFFDHIAKQEDVKDLVLLGDFFDTWMFPMDAQLPKTLAEVITARHPTIIEAVKSARKAVENVFYVNGNHDMHVTQEDLNAVFGADVATWIPRYNAGLLYAEHGSRFTMFNAPDKMHDPLDGLPLGYFITRMLASTNEEYDRPGSVIKYIDDLLEAAFTPTTVAQSVIEAIAELAGKKPHDTFTMPNRRPTITIADVQRRYAPLFQRWIEKFGQRYAIQAVMGELGSLGWFADRLCEKQGYKVVVFGHTHGSELDKDSFLIKGNRAYANAGYWCPKPDRKDDRATFVEVDKVGGKFSVQLWSYKGGKPNKEKIVVVG